MVLGNKYFTLLHFILQDRVYSKKGSNEDGEWFNNTEYLNNLSNLIFNIFLD